MTGYDPADPLPTFCFNRSADVVDSHLRQYVLLSKIEPPQVLQKEDAPKAASYRTSPRCPPRPCSWLRCQDGDEEQGQGQTRRRGLAGGRYPGPHQLQPPGPLCPGGHDGRRGVGPRSMSKLPDNLTRYRLVPWPRLAASSSARGK